jgi:hypothetical protein
MNRENQSSRCKQPSIVSNSRTTQINTEKPNNLFTHSRAGNTTFNKRQAQSPTPIRRKSPSRRSPTKAASGLEKETKTSVRNVGIKERENKPPVDDYDDEEYEETESEEDNGKKEKKTRKSPRKTKRKINKWAEMIGYITNSVAAQVGYPIRAEEFMPIIRKNYPGNPPAKKKISKDVYEERAKAKFQILKEVDESLIDKANKSISEIVQVIKKERKDM